MANEVITDPLSLPPTWAEHRVPENPVQAQSLTQVSVAQSADPNNCEHQINDGLFEATKFCGVGLFCCKSQRILILLFLSVGMFIRLSFPQPRDCLPPQFVHYLDEQLNGN